MAVSLPSVTPKSRSRFALRWYSWLLLAGVIVYGIAWAMHWDDRGVLWVAERFETPAERQASVWLPDYHAVIDGKLLPGMEKDEASDVSYNPQTKTLFSVMGKNPFLVELSLQGDVLRKMPLIGWNNAEGLAVMENGLMAIVDERMHTLTVVKVDASTQQLNIADFKSYDLGPSKDQNKAFEGVAWDKRNQQIVLGEERPPALFTWKSDGSTLTGDKQKVANTELDMRNLSALAVDPRTGHLLVLSADSHLLLELDAKGQQVSFMTVLGGFNGLKNTIPRAEGVTMDEDGTLYMVSEPNLFYRFEKQK
ncbi:SdiA-regulated domain-containing protein [Pseudomonas sp. ICMP 460]|uniref:SdiA-regulated domain-containing protein n=1 Tax=Pseudomonas sp. ICMP 460 TaxID=1718917 RepID=UPI000C081DA2|nr:SdiA-regulated domain-containing protein [Pseudomonas sp. ICMP 460]PHN33103.1 DNA-binding protein [Pseudomonas sp. ICMP 460]